MSSSSGIEKINLAEKFAAFRDHWSPKILADLNGQQVKAAKFKGAFVWHHHEAEDEMFLVHRGTFRMEFRDHVVTLAPGDFIVVPRGVEHRPVADEEVEVLLVVPRGVEHRPVADEEVEVLLFEPASTRNTGSVQNERTVAVLDRI